MRMRRIPAARATSRRRIFVKRAARRLTGRAPNRQRALTPSPSLQLLAIRAPGVAASLGLLGDSRREPLPIARFRF